MRLGKSGALCLMAASTEPVRRCFQQGRLIAAVPFMADAAILLGRGMGHAILPMGGYGLMAGEAEVRARPDQMLLFPGTMGQMTSSAIEGPERLMDIFLLGQLQADTVMALQAQLPGFFALQIAVIPGMGPMAGHALSLLKGRMALAFRLLLGQSVMTAQTELPPLDLFDKQGLLFCLMGVMTAAALPGGKGPMQAEAGQILIDLLMAVHANIPVPFYKEHFFLGLVGNMTGGAFVPSRGRMGAWSTAILIPAVAPGAEHRRIRLEAALFTQAMTGMTAQTLAVLHRDMGTPARRVGPLLVTFQTELCCGHGQQGRFLTGMDAVALAAFAFLHRRMLAGKQGSILTVACSAEKISPLGRPEQLRAAPLVAFQALALGNGLMDHCLQQSLACGTVRVMAPHAVPLQEMALVGLAQGRAAALMALAAKAVRLLGKEKRLPAPMGVMADHAPLGQRGMNIFFLVIFPVMAVIAGLFLLLAQQSGMGRIMTGMTGGTVALAHRIMERNRARVRPLALMTAQTELGFFLAEKHAANDAMGQMTGVTVVLAHRGMHNPLPEPGCHVAVTIHAGFPLLLDRGLFPAGGKQQPQSCENNKQFT